MKSATSQSSVDITARPNGVASTIADSEMGDEFETDKTQTLTFDSKVRRVKASEQTPGSHEVTFSVTIAMAISSIEEEMGQRNANDHRMSTADIPKALSHLHLEYKLFPDDSDTMKSDVVFYGTGAKVYPDRYDARAVKVWRYKHQSWVAWKQNFRIHVSDNILKSLCNHQLTIKVWDTREKCGSKARFDKPKGFRFPMAQLGQDPDRIGGVKDSVLGLCERLENTPSARINNERALPQPDDNRPVTVIEDYTEKREDAVSPEKISGAPPSENFAVYALSRPGQHPTNLPFDRLNKLAGSHGTELVEQTRLPSGGGGRTSKTPASRNKSSAPNSAKQGGNISQPSPQPTDVSGLELSPDMTDRRSTMEASRTGGRGRKGKVIDPEQEIYDKHGRFSVTLNLAHLFTRPSVIERIPEPTVSVDDMIVYVNLDESLLSDVQKITLNPMIIRVKSAKDMPSTPMNYDELHRRCELAYCQYQFFNLPLHRTVGKQQSKQLVWDDIQIILTGLIDLDTLKEYIGGAALTIEVHDRDKRPTKEALTAALFGNDLEDEKIYNIGVVTSKRTAHSAFGNQQKSWDSFGLCKIPMNDLLRGPTLISLTVPITQCSNTDVLGIENTKDGKVTGVSGAVDGPTEPSLPVGHFIETNSSLTVSFEVFHSLSTKTTIERRLQQTNSCPFGKIIFIMSAQNGTFMNSVRRVIKNLNAQTLGLENSPDHVISTSLHNYKMKPDEIQNTNFNLITGFHVFDGVTHVFALEGPKTGCIQSIWFSLGRDLIRRDDIRVLFNDDYSFSKRLHSDLDADIGQIRIHDSLENITQQPLLYVRDIVPKDCFQGIVRLRDLTTSKTLQAIISNEFLPSSSMIKAVSREFGLPISVSGDINEESECNGRMTDVVSRPTNYVSVSRWTKRLDNLNESYMQSLHERQGEGNGVDHVQVNIERVREASFRVHQSRVQSCPAIKIRVPEQPDREAFNYSNQTLNSVMQAKEVIRQQCDPKKRYTYSHRFLHSATIEPVNIEATLKSESAKKKSHWRTARGWVYPGFKSDLDANVHSKLPDQARRESVNQPWRENQLHAAVLKPTLEGRENYTSTQRKQDFNLFAPPRGVFKQEPYSIMPTGVEKSQEAAANAEHEFQQWSRSMIVNDHRLHIHRVLPETEMRIDGLRAANQIDCLQGMRKDPPMKHGLVNPGYQDIPALRVLGIDSPSPNGNYTVDNSERGDLRKNFVPRREQARGFNPIYKSREVISLHKIVPLKPSERKNNLFFKQPISECM